MIFEYPGNIRTYTVTEDADRSGNRVWAIGGGQGLDQIYHESRDDAQLTGGWPLLETSVSYKDVFNPDELVEKSQQALERLRPPVKLITAEVDPFSEPDVKSYSPGDWARFIILDDFDNPGIDAKYRITGVNVSVAADTPLDRVTLDLSTGVE